MTDYSKMTDEQVNEAIARIKGVGYGIEIINGRPMVATIDIGRYAELPRYTHDWRLAGELLEELGQSTPVELTRLHNLDKWGFGITGNEPDVYGSTPQRAICEAWLAWKEQR